MMKTKYDFFLRINKRKAKESGFTLAEIMLAIVIVAILFAIAIPIYLHQKQRANDGVVMTDVRNYADKVESYLLKHPGATNLTTALINGENPVINSGVTINVQGNSGKYCVTGFHANGKEYKQTKPLIYDSVSGDFGKAGQTCSIAVYTAPEVISAYDGYSNVSPNYLVVKLPNGYVHNAADKYFLRQSSTSPWVQITPTKSTSGVPRSQFGGATATLAYNNRSTAAVKIEWSVGTTNIYNISQFTVYAS